MTVGNTIKLMFWHQPKETPSSGCGYTLPSPKKIDYFCNSENVVIKIYHITDQSTWSRKHRGPPFNISVLPPHYFDVEASALISIQENHTSICKHPSNVSKVYLLLVLDARRQSLFITLQQPCMWRRSGYIQIKGGKINALNYVFSRYQSCT